LTVSVGDAALAYCPVLWHTFTRIILYCRMARIVDNDKWQWWE